jgi:hypothetical protein
MRSLLISAIALAALGFTCGGASAEPVQRGPYGCPVKQLQSPGGMQCEKKQESMSCMTG